jgi:hypothetical protein
MADRREVLDIGQGRVMTILERPGRYTDAIWVNEFAFSYSIGVLDHLTEEGVE